MPDDPDVKAIVRAVASYLRVNPNACDTADGIQRWWLLTQPEYPMSKVVLALDWMVRRSVISVSSAADGRRRFRRNSTDAQLIALAEQEDDSDAVLSPPRN